MNSDKFYAVFRRAPSYDSGRQYLSENEANDAARRQIEREPDCEMFVMTTITKFTAKRPIIEIIRTEVEM